jgi:prevent-host-death family protein
MGIGQLGSPAKFRYSHQTSHESHAMESINLADAKARFSEIVDRAEAGESIEITRRGKIAARIGPATTEQPRKPIDLEALRKFRESTPFQSVPAVDIIREMRDAGY